MATARPRAALALATAALSAIVWLGACAAAPAGPREPNYFRRIAFRLWPDTVTLRWPESRMPLGVYLPPPPQDLFEDPAPVAEAVRRGVRDWSDVAAPGVPSFELVDDPGEADIPFRWEREPTGDWFIAHCVWDISPRMRRFGVASVLLTGRRRDGRLASPEELYVTVLHEMGHALGLGGHSDEPADVMYGEIRARQTGLTARDRTTLRMLYERPNGFRVVGARRERY